MSSCVEKLSHSCGSKDGLQVFLKEDGGYDGFCFACSTYVPNPYTDPNYKPPEVKRKTKEEIQAEIEEILECPTGLGLDERKLLPEYLEYFGYRFGLSLADGKTPEVAYRPAYSAATGELVGFSPKLLTKKVSWWVYHKQDIDLFGWNKAILTGAKKLYITEGQEDAVALFQVMKERNKGTPHEKFDPAVVSLTHGAACAVQQLSRLQDKINKSFKEVILVFDMDKAGLAAREEVVKKVFPNAKVADLPCKDANECLKEGRSKALFNAVQFDASVAKNTRLVSGRELILAAKQPAKFGVSWPWEGLTKATRGIRKGETIYLGAGVKMGKSELVDAVGAHLIMAHGWKILFAKPEQANVQTFKRLVGKAVGRIFHDPEVAFDEEAYDRGAEMLADNVYLLDLYQHLGWLTLQQDIRAAAANGVDAVFIDPITNVSNGMSAADANTHLQEVAQELASMAMDLNIVIFIMAHLRNPDNGPSHDRGGKVLSSQFAGSRAMARSCNLMMGLEGNKDPDLPLEQKNIRKLVILEDREFGSSETINLYWDQATGLYNEIKI